jgi:hypothetical protein
MSGKFGGNRKDRSPISRVKVQRRLREHFIQFLQIHRKEPAAGPRSFFSRLNVLVLPSASVSACKAESRGSSRPFVEGRIWLLVRCPVGENGPNHIATDDPVYAFGGRTTVASTSIRKPGWASARTPTDVLAGSAAFPRSRRLTRRGRSAGWRQCRLGSC